MKPDKVLKQLKERLESQKKSDEKNWRYYQGQQDCEKFEKYWEGCVRTCRYILAEIANLENEKSRGKK